MKKLLFLLLFLPFCSQAQVPEPHMLSLKGIGGGGLDNILSTIFSSKDENFVIGITSSSAAGSGNIDSFCTMSGSYISYINYKSDLSEKIWSKCSKSGNHIFEKENGDFIFGGTTNAATSGKAFIIVKEDESGNTIWYKKYGDGASAILKSMITTEDGGYLMLGEVYYSDTDVLVHYGSWSFADIWILKLDSNGNKVWSKVIGGSFEDSPISLVPAPNNGCYVLGATQSSDYDCTGYHAGGQDAYLARLDQDGNLLWHRCLGGSGYEAGYNSGNIIPDGKGGIIMSVSTSSKDGDVSHHISETDYWLINIDSNGNKLWDNCYHFGNFEYPTSLCKSTDGSIWVNGWTSQNYDDAFLVHTDSIGNLLHSKILGSSKMDQGKFIHSLKDGLVLVSGFYFDKSGSFSSLNYYGSTDVFLAVFAPWSVGMNDIENDELLFKIYPNPAKGILYVEKQNNNSNNKISLMSIDGKQMIQTILASGNTHVEIDVSQFPKGNYWVRISSDTHKSISQKITIE